MTADQERVLKACQEVCGLLASEAMDRINVSITDDKDQSGRTRWLLDQKEAFLRLRRELAAGTSGSDA